MTEKKAKKDDPPDQKQDWQPPGQPIGWLIGKEEKEPWYYRWLALVTLSLQNNAGLMDGEPLGSVITAANMARRLPSELAFDVATYQMGELLAMLKSPNVPEGKFLNGAALSVILALIRAMECLSREGRLI